MNDLNDSLKHLRGLTSERKKKVKKMKKVLDRGATMWYNKAPAAKRRAPCKLNNVKKHEAPEKDKTNGCPEA